MKATLLSTSILAGVLTGGLLVAAQRSERLSDPDRGYVAHEWGTFTDVQGSDGVQMLWTPVIAPDLPNFVFRQNPYLGFKGSLVTRQRMETPVIYFYSDRARTLDVSVNFPLGLVTEWYPLRSAADPGMRLPGMSKKPSLRWEHLQVLPAASTAALPKDNTASHYYAARATDASLLQINTGSTTETEKFLFYRGAGSFEAPLTVKMEAGKAGRVILQNKGGEPLAHLFLYQVTAQGGVWVSIPSLAAGETRTVALPESGSAPLSELAPALRDALVVEGLYEKEAAAMVKTWEDAWFAERGLRVLYTLPRAWTDRTLPLQLAPTAQTVDRVMVGRAEIITPASEQALLSLTERYVAAPGELRAPIIAEVRALGLGRFLRSTFERALKDKPAAEYYLVREEMLKAIEQPAPAVALNTKAR